MARPRKDSVKIPTKTRILTAAEDQFGQYGYSSASLADIASRAGIRRASLLYHFASKDLSWLCWRDRRSGARSRQVSWALGIGDDW